MWLFFIRPEQNREKKKEEMRSSIRVGDQITTIGGIVGRVTRVNEDTIIIQTGADRVRIEVKKWAVGSVGDDEPETASDSAKKAAKKKKKEAEEAAAASKPSPKQIKKLGAKSEDTAAEGETTAEAAQSEAPAQETEEDK